MTPKLEEALLALASKLGTTAEHLWGVLVKHAYVGSCVGLTVQLLLILTAIPAARFLYTTLCIGEDLDNSDCMRCTFAGVVTTAGIVALGILPNTLTSFLVPEAEALRNILGMLR